MPEITAKKIPQYYKLNPFYKVVELFKTDIDPDKFIALFKEYLI